MSEPRPERGDNREKMTRPVEEFGTHQARADLVFRQGSQLRQLGVICVPSPLGAGSGRVAGEVDRGSSPAEHGRCQSWLDRGVSQHVTGQDNELARVQLREVTHLLPEQPVGGTRHAEVEVPIIGDHRLLAEAADRLERVHILRGGLE